MNNFINIKPSNLSYEQFYGYDDQKLYAWITLQILWRRLSGRSASLLKIIILRLKHYVVYKSKIIWLFVCILIKY